MEKSKKDNQIEVREGKATQVAGSDGSKKTAVAPRNIAPLESISCADNCSTDYTTCREDQCYIVR